MWVFEIDGIALIYTEHGGAGKTAIKRGSTLRSSLFSGASDRQNGVDFSSTDNFRFVYINGKLIFVKKVLEEFKMPPLTTRGI